MTLFVALIGVMGSMLAAAHEKTGRSGILLALGAQPHDIRRTFLLQAVLLCLFGGIVGLAAAGALLHFGAALLLPEGRVFAGLLILSTLSGAAARTAPGGSCGRSQSNRRNMQITLFFRLYLCYS